VVLLVLVTRLLSCVPVLFTVGLSVTNEIAVIMSS